MLQVLVKSGRGIEEGVKLIHLTAGTTKDTKYKGLAEHFSPHELQALIEMERQALTAQELLLQITPMNDNV